MTAAYAIAARWWRQVLLLAALSSLLGWLFLQAGAVSPTAHYRYQRDLRELAQVDTEINAGVLAAHAELSLNYDALVAHLRRARAALAAIGDLPAYLDGETRMAMLRQIATLKQAHAEKADLIDRYQRSNAVWRNSVDYFPHAAERLLAQSGMAGRPGLEAFVRDVLVLSRSPRPELEASLRERMAALAALPLPAAARRDLDHLMLHAALIVARHGEIDHAVRVISTAPTVRHLEDLTRLYAAGHERSLERAANHRTILLLLALGFLAYGAAAYLRHERDRLALQRAHAELHHRFVELQLAEDRVRLYASVFSHASEGMTITDPAGRIVAVNPAFCAITGYAAEEVLGQTPAVLKSGRQDAEFYRVMWQALEAGGAWSGEVWNRRRDGSVYPEWLSITAVRDAQGAVCNYVGIFADISERKEVEQRVQFLAHHDALTGLPNRILLEDRIAQAVLKSHRNDRAAAVLFLDLDRFKNINDTLGHNVGDDLLVQAARRAVAVLRETDTLSRQGGDEFVVVLPELESPQDAAHVARKLLQAIGAPYHLAGHDLVVTGSIGIALYPDDGISATDLLRNADTAMYRAKDEGRNAFRYYDSGMNFATLGELLLESHLRNALDRGELLLHYQPKVDAISGRLVSAEALMRWQHPEHGLIPPGRFIPLAEECGLIVALGAWALRTVAKQQRAWLDAGLAAVPVAVNVSAKQFDQDDVPGLVAEVLETCKLPPRLIDIELTESLLMRDPERAGEVLRRLRELDVAIAIDDFGTGYSSLSYLDRFPLQALKIDRSFVQAIAPTGEAKLVQAIIALAHNMNMKVIAEGVETEAQREHLARHGCDLCQGYLFAKPLPTDEFAAWLRPAGAAST